MTSAVRRSACSAAFAAILLGPVPNAASGSLDGVALPVGSAGERSITYVGVMHDQTDLRKLNIGRSGYWFAQFDAAQPVAGRPTGERAVDSLPPWVRPLNHTSGPTDPGCDLSAVADGCLPTYLFRTFSQDGPARSMGGQERWNTFVLPDGTEGLSGAIVDPQTSGNSNNTVNRIQLRDAVPSTFYFHVVTDNTDGQHDPTNLVQARGNIGLLDADLQVDPAFFPRTCDLTFNGVADVHTFRFDGFVPGDYLKLRLNGDRDGTGASFSGFLFDETFEPAGSFRRAPRGKDGRGQSVC